MLRTRDCQKLREGDLFTVDGKALDCRRVLDLTPVGNEEVNITSEWEFPMGTNKGIFVQREYERRSMLRVTKERKPDRTGGSGLYLVEMRDGIEPAAHGPFASPEERDRLARRLRGGGDDDATTRQLISLPRPPRHGSRPCLPFNSMTGVANL